REVLDHDVCDASALQQRKVRGDLRFAFEMEPFFEAAIEFEAIARSGDKRALNDVRPFAVRVLADKTNAVADLKAFRVGQRYFLIPMIAIDDEFRFYGRFLEQHRVGSAPDEPDFRRKKNRVA